MTPELQGIDHVHVFVRDRDRAVRWYREVLGFEPVTGLEAWAADGGPLTLGDAGGHIHLALFERPPQPNRATLALRTDAAGLARWFAHLSRHLGTAPTMQDHALSLSLYFSDPDGNPYEITTYEHAAARQALGR